MFIKFFDKTGPGSDAVSMVEAMHAAGITKRVLETLPEAILTPLRDAISRCQPRPPASWSKELLHLVGRGDISLILEPPKKSRSNVTDVLVSQKEGIELILCANDSRPRHTVPRGISEPYARASKSTTRSAVTMPMARRDRQ